MTFSPESVLLPFPASNRIALVVRGKPNRHTAPADEGHADCILPSGAPVGYFMHEIAERIGVAPISAPGQVYTYSLFRANRPWYVDLQSSYGAGAISGVLVMEVSTSEADAFLRAWTHLRAHTDEFSILGNNCATHAARAFARAGLVAREIPDLDTPNSLFRALRRRHYTRCTDYYGYLGFAPMASSADPLTQPFSVAIEAYADGSARHIPEFI